eukprot:scaffold140273_cov35-Attheya_sp.AAC.1
MGQYPAQGILFIARRSPWEQHFQELIKFKEINGHANIPTRLGQLERWVSTQCRDYHLLQAGKDSQLTIDNCEKLESIGFEFNCHSRSTWDQRFQDLVDFKKINGHTNVPSHSGRLGGWVSKQRTRYAYFQAGEDSPLTID